MPACAASMRVAAFEGWIALAFTLSACSAVVDADPRKLGPKPVPCDPGSSVTCICANGASSLQNCNALRRYDPCSCMQPVAGSGSES
jgi:hypothetical protein